MKKLMILSAAVLMFAACANEDLIDKTHSPNGKEGPISFMMSQKNMTRASQDLQKTGHYNFGVFAYKSTEATNNIMENYLVGYSDQTNKLGYAFGADQTTKGDDPGLENGKSMWQYEGLGNTEYSYVGEEGYYKTTDTEYMSNVDKQYLRYWDLSAPTTTFYAYAPYINGAAKTATYDNSTKVMTIPDGSIVAGYDDPTNNEYMYAVNEIANSDYGKDVPLNFKRINAKVNIKFWEDIDGYSVRILNLSDTHSKGVYAKPAKFESSSYAVAKLLVKGGASIDFTDPAAPQAAVVDDAADDKSDECLTFAAPTAAEIGTTRLLASPSATTYYAVPQPTDTEAGLTFHVSYELTSTTGEKIVVKDATVHVPVANVSWKSNTHYTYIFKITANANGSTATNPTINPDSPDVPVEPALYPIIFDNCTVDDYDVVESDHNITDGTDPVYYSVSLDKQTVKAAEGGTVTATLKEQGTPVASPSGTYTVTGPDATNVTCTTAGVVTVQTGAKTGIYTVTYTEPASGNHPGTYSATFYVIGQYAAAVSTSEIGTGGKAATTLTVTITEAGGNITPASEKLSIVYPAGLTGDQKNKVHFISATEVQVEKDAVPGSYKVAYTTDEGTAYADFEVVNYGLTLSTYVINHNNTNQTITATAGGSGSVSLVGAPATITLSGNTITVDKTTAEGTYTVQSTVNKSGSVTVYEKTFTVKNVYVLTLSQTTVDNDENSTIGVTSTINAVASDNIEITPTDSHISYSAGSITVSAGAATGTYTVKLKNGSDEVVATATFIVQD